jgi:uncharacterized protein YgiM (DUF1202 family)
MPSSFRLRWPVDSRTITQRFGENPSIYAKFNQAGHEGLDFAAPVGARIYACADGKVLDIHPDDGNAYGLHVRVQHLADGREYHTIYAHLSRVLVTEGQSVQAGELICLAGETGHTYGPHLHLTLKLIGAHTPGYPAGTVDPFPYLQEGHEVEFPQPSDLTIYTTDRVRLRASATTASAQLAWLEEGEPLVVLGDADQARAKVGQQGQWVQVQRAGGMSGFVAAWYLQLESPAPTPPEPAPVSDVTGELVVYATQALNVRKGPSTEYDRVAIALPHEPLAVFGDRDIALSRVGDRGQWLRVQLPNLQKGYVAAWYVQTAPGPAPETLLTVYPTENMNMRERPTVTAAKIGRPARNTSLSVHDDPERARALVGRYDEWLYVETEEGQYGWVAAWYVSTTQA